MKRDPVDRAMYELSVLSRESDGRAEDLLQADVSELIEGTRVVLAELVAHQSALLQLATKASGESSLKEMDEMMNGTLAHLTVWFKTAEKLQEHGLGSGPHGASQ